jgi:hypothetical protein
MRFRAAERSQRALQACGAVAAGMRTLHGGVRGGRFVAGLAAGRRGQSTISP